MKHLRWLIALTLCLILVSAAAMAEPAFSGGSGTSADPYLISTKDDLVMLAKFVNEQGGGEGRYYKQTADIDLAGVDWVPIGKGVSDDDADEGLTFSSNYDGGNHSISNAVSKGIKNNDEGWIMSGIFGMVYNGSVKNLHVKNSKFTASADASDYFYIATAGGIAAASSSSSFENCSVTGCTISAKNPYSPETTYAGGVVGAPIYSVNFMKCASVKNMISSQAYSGGFAGYSMPILDYSLFFEGCYVAECSATVNLQFDDITKYTNAASGFIGCVCEGSISVKKSFVYGTNVEIKGDNGDPSYSMKDVFANTDIGSYPVESPTLVDCLYGKCNVSNNNTPSTKEMTEQQFKGGTVINKLNSSGNLFTQSGGSSFPVIGANPAADYTVIYRAIEAASSLDPDQYKDFSAVSAAVDAATAAVADSGLSNTEVNALAAAIMSAIDNLERLPDPTVKPTAKPTPAPTAAPTAAPNLPKTGDGSLFPLWALLLLASCAGVLLLKARRRCN